MGDEVADAVLDEIDGALGALDDWALDDMLVGETDTDDLIELWLRLDHIASTASQVCRAVAGHATSRLIDRDDPTAVHVTNRGTPVHLRPGTPKVEWRGRALVRKLGRPMLTGDGEHVDAVPVDVLLDVLPAVGDDDAVSSRWTIAGLKRHLPEWARYYTKHDAPLSIRLVK